MLFNSYEFIFYYLPVVFAGFFFIARRSHGLAGLWLAAASLFFYGWWNPKFVALMLASILFNYAMGRAMSVAREKPAAVLTSKSILTFAVTTNLILLGYFKYTNFFIGAVNQFADVHISPTAILLPLGISFFTFTQIAFLVDSHRGIAREYNFVHYLLFVTYFPHLIAGPVLHHKQMMPQFAQARTYSPSSVNIALGLILFSLGLAKKVLLADTFSPLVAPAFDLANSGQQPQFTQAWEAALSYTFQLYFDFSGYSDMAIGLSLLFGVRLPINFNSPYKAWNIVEFWRRWHITLSHFLRDYLYIPLGGNRSGATGRYINILITMILGGLWHGANWTFLLWGSLHGLFIVINHGWHHLRSRLGFPVAGRPSAVGRVFGVALTFFCVVVAWVLFRADSVSAAWLVLRSMANWSDATNMKTATAVTLATGALVVFFLPNTISILAHIEKHLSNWRGMLYTATVAAIAALCVLNINGESAFLYFQF